MWLISDIHIFMYMCVFICIHTYTNIHIYVHITPSLQFTEVSSQIAAGEQRSVGEALRLPRGEGPASQPAGDRLLHEGTPTLPTYTASVSTTI